MDGIKRPLVALLVANDREMRKAILKGRKQITIREGDRDYHAFTTVMLCDHEKPWCVMADIVEVRHCTLSKVTREEMKADGFEDFHQMLMEMRRFYPNLEWNSPVTVIRWENVRGKLVDDWAEIRKSGWTLQTGDPLD